MRSVTRRLVGMMVAGAYIVGAACITTACIKTMGPRKPRTLEEGRAWCWDDDKADACMVIAEAQRKALRDQKLPADRLPPFVRDYERACELGHDEACGRAAWYLLRAGMPRPRIVDLGSRGCEAGSRYGCLAAGRAWHGWTEQPGAAAEAEQMFRAICNAQTRMGCADLGYLLGEELNRPDRQREGADFFEYGCDHNDRHSCRGLGAAFEIGRGRPQDYRKAFALYRKACDLKHPNACHLVGVLQGAGRGVDAIDQEKAFAWMVHACELGDGPACGDVAGRLLEGKGAEVDGKKGRVYAERGCDLGSGAACTWAARFHGGRAGHPIDEVRKEQFWRRACELKDGLGCRAVAEYYTPKNDEARGRAFDEALAVAEATCRLPYHSGAECVEAAEILFRSINPHRDEARGRAFVEDACARDFPHGCAWLGQSLVKGWHGWEVDRERGLALLEKACRWGRPYACEDLARALITPEASEADLDRAVWATEESCKMKPSCRFFAEAHLYRLPEERRRVDRAVVYGRRGCDDGDGWYCAQVGQALLNRPELARNEDEAIALLERGCVLGTSFSCDLGVRQALDRSGPDDDRAISAMLAKARAEGWGLARKEVLLAAQEGTPVDPTLLRAVVDETKQGCLTIEAGCYDVIVVEREGWGVPADPAAAHAFATEYLTLRLDRCLVDQDAATCNNLAWKANQAGLFALAERLAARSLELAPEQDPDLAADTLVVARMGQGKVDGMPALVLEAAQRPEGGALRERLVHAKAGRWPNNLSREPDPTLAEVLAELVAARDLSSLPAAEGETRAGATTQEAVAPSD